MKFNRKAIENVSLGNSVSMARTIIDPEGNQTKLVRIANGELGVQMTEKQYLEFRRLADETFGIEDEKRNLEKQNKGLRHQIDRIFQSSI